MIVGFENKPGIGLVKHHCFTLLGMQDNLVDLYNPFGDYVFITESDFYENLNGLFISYFKNYVFRFPEIKTFAEFSKT